MITFTEENIKEIKSCIEHPWYEMQQARELREQTGIPLSDCIEALQKCDHELSIALDYLWSKNDATARYKKVNGVLIPWNDEDYIKSARRGHIE